jgi:hypothetical protein
VNGSDPDDPDPSVPVGTVVDGGSTVEPWVPSVVLVVDEGAVVEPSVWIVVLVVVVGGSVVEVVLDVVVDVEGTVVEPSVWIVVLVVVGATVVVLVDVDVDDDVDVEVEVDVDVDVVVGSTVVDVVVGSRVVDVVLVEVDVDVDVELVLEVDVVLLDVSFVQSNGSHTVTPLPMFHVSERNPCLPATNAVTSIGNNAGATPSYGNVNDASSLTGTTPAGGGVVPYTKCSVM